MTTDTEALVAFNEEVMYCGFSETHTAGAKVTFWLQDAAQLDFFRALKVRSRGHAGARFQLLLVELNDDDTPVDQKAAAAVHGKGGALAKLAGQWCQRDDFQGWLRQRYATQWEEAHQRLVADLLPTSDAEVAAELVRFACGVGSRAELDHSDEARQLFERRIRKPFMATQDDRDV